MATLAFYLWGQEDKGKSSSLSHAAKVQTSEQTTIRWVDQILSNYNAGHYQNFLKQADDQYQKSNKAWKYNALLEERKKLSSLVKDFDSQKTDTFKIKIKGLNEAKERELIDLCLCEKSTPLTREVKEMIFFTPSRHEVESLNFIHNIGSKFKGDGSSPIENKLINIDIEFWLKIFSLDVLLTENKIDQKNYQEKRIVLEFEKLHQMKEACMGKNVSAKIKDYIDTAYKVYPKTCSASLTRKYLNDLVTGKVAPANQTEEKIKAIGVKYTEKEKALIKRHFAQAKSPSSSATSSK